MKLQENMMTFTVFAAVVYGLWFYLAPASYFSLMMMPADLVNAVAINQLQNTGIGLFVLAYLFNALRKGASDSNRSEMMQHHAVGWGTWGVLMLAMMIVVSSGSRRLILPCAPLIPAALLMETSVPIGAMSS